MPINKNEDGTTEYDMSGTVHMPDIFGTKEAKTPLFGEGVPGLEKLLPSEEAMLETYKEAFKLFRRKHRDYGPGNLARFGVLGLIVRMSDKQARLERLIQNDGKNLVADESMRDTFLDLLNYAAAAIVMLDEKWE